MMQKSAIVVHSGGMDSSICLALAIREFGEANVLSISFRYDQRHAIELERSAKICVDWNVDHIELDIPCLSQITQNALTDHQLTVDHQNTNQVPNTLVVGRNGLMARLAAIHADSLGAHCIYLGVIEVESANSGYRDCSREYMDLMQQILRLDLDSNTFEIRTPVVKMTKCETLEVAYDMGMLAYLLENTVTCYEGIPHQGCGDCPACYLRNQGIDEFKAAHPDFKCSW
ncbi:MAG: 7-cyano-7-deazaguanine synthase QueC [Coxiella sp. (in: Bacteria)]|nr:MAG: 7-cyano-7-deazaguanine synthase QueC [Coxiella sp. (in: g-proteobacteria)]